MAAAVLEPPNMAKRKDDKVEPASPADTVRYVGKMTRGQRAAFRYFCDLRGLDMEKVGVQWIMERLAAEESKSPRNK